MLRCQIPLNFATKAFSYNLARFLTSFCCKMYNILLSCMRISLLPFIPFLSTGKVLASALQKTWKWNIDQLGDLTYFTTNFAPKVGHVFSGIALPEFGRYSKWTPVWIDLSCCITCLAKQSGVVRSDDVTRGSMPPDSNVGKIRLLTRKS